MKVSHLLSSPLGQFYVYITNLDIGLQLKEEERQRNYGY